MKEFCDQKKYLVIAAAAGIIASFLPWASISGIINQSVNGLDGDGKLTIVLFAVAGYFVIKGNKNEELSGNALYVVIGAFGLAGLIGLYDWSNMTDKLKSIHETNSKFGFKKSVLDVKIGLGLYLTAIAGVVGVAVPFLLKGKVNKGTENVD
jgi:hypothetical protein